MIRWTLAVCALLATPALAQQETSQARGALVRTLDKLSGTTRDIEIPVGQAARFGRITISLQECRFPVGNPSGDAFAALQINEVGRDDALFRGWMIASAPALSAMDHARFDVWVIRCTTA